MSRDDIRHNSSQESGRAVPFLLPPEIHKFDASQAKKKKFRMKMMMVIIKMN